MVEVGSLEIAGTINVEGIRSGLNSIKRGLSEAKEAAKSAFGDMNRLGGTIKDLAKPLAIIGSTISGMFLGLAALSPQVAPYIEKMKSDFFRLATILGDNLAPVIETISNKFSNFVDWLDAHPWAQDMIADLTILAGILGVGGVLFKALSAFHGLLMSLPGFVKIGIILYLAGLAGAHIGQKIGELTYEDIGRGVMEKLSESELGQSAITFLAHDVGGTLDTVFGTSITKNLQSKEVTRQVLSKEVEEERMDETIYKYGGI